MQIKDGTQMYAGLINDVCREHMGSKYDTVKKEAQGDPTLKRFGLFYLELDKHPKITVLASIQPNTKESPANSHLLALATQAATSSDKAKNCPLVKLGESSGTALGLLTTLSTPKLQQAIVETAQRVDASFGLIKPAKHYKELLRSYSPEFNGESIR